MKTSRIVLVAVLLTVLASLSAVIIAAQETTEEAPEATEVPSSFSDNRINGDIYLAGMAVYCVDESGSTDTNTYQNGGITVWGADGQEYIALTVAQLRGDEEVPQPAVPMEMTEEPMMDVTPTATEAMTESGDEAMATEEMMPEPVLLARAQSMTGPIWLYRIADDVFALQGNDEHGKFYTYTWTGCSLGVLSTDTEPFSMDEMSMMEESTEMESMATEEMMPAETMMPTAEATASS